MADPIERLLEVSGRRSAQSPKVGSKVNVATAVELRRAVLTLVPVEPPASGVIPEHWPSRLLELELALSLAPERSDSPHGTDLERQPIGVMRDLGRSLRCAI